MGMERPRLTGLLTGTTGEVGFTWPTTALGFKRAWLQGAWLGVRGLGFTGPLS